MYIAATNPMGLSDKDISKEILERELDIAKESAFVEKRKPEQM